MLMGDGLPRDERIDFYAVGRIKKALSHSSRSLSKDLRRVLGAGVTIV